MLPRLKQPCSGQEKIDRLGWADGITFVAYGASIGIRVNEPAVLERLPCYLPPGWKASTSPEVDYLYSLRVNDNGTQSGRRRFHRLYAGATMLLQTMDLNKVFDQLECALDDTVAFGARSKLFVHAGVVGWRGRAIVIPGRSGSGKSSLVEALVRAGATYYSDEYAVFDADGRVHPYPRALCIRVAGGQRVRRYPMEKLEDQVGTRPLIVGLIVITHYQPGARWRPRAFSPGQSLLMLLANTFVAYTHPQFAMATLGRAVPRALGLQGKRGEAHHMVQQLLDRMVEQTLSIPSEAEPCRRSPEKLG
jgi:hypothetical protein